MHRFFAFLFFATGLAVMPPAVYAHEINTSYTELAIVADTLRLKVELDEGDLMRTFPLDDNGDQMLWRNEMLAGVDTVSGFMETHLALEVDGVSVELQRWDGKVRRDGDGNAFLAVYFIVPLDEAPAEIDLKVGFCGLLSESHKNLAKILVPGRPLEQTVFSADAERQQFIVGKKVSLFDQFFRFVWWGVEHIFLGYDHIMFLLALIVVGGRLGSLIKIVTAFTLAHSITLALAALEVVALPARWIEAGIALSIVYVALENFWLARSDHRWILTFFFGLVHGFGFANVLRELGLPAQGLAVSLFAFNLGVEVGQIGIVALCFPLIMWLGHQSFQRPVMLTVSAVILLFGLGWLIERVFELSFMPL